MPRSLNPLLWLAVGSFAIGAEGFMIAGLLPALARDLSVGLPAAGHLVTTFSLAYAIGAADGGVGRLGWVAAGFSVAALLAVGASGRAAVRAGAVSR